MPASLPTLSIFPVTNRRSRSSVLVDDLAEAAVVRRRCAATYRRRGRRCATSVRSTCRIGSRPCVALSSTTLLEPRPMTGRRSVPANRRSGIAGWTCCASLREGRRGQRRQRQGGQRGEKVASVGHRDSPRRTWPRVFRPACCVNTACRAPGIYGAAGRVRTDPSRLARAHLGRHGRARPVPGRASLVAQQRLLTRAIPSSGEMLPVIGLGSSATFSQVARKEDATALREVLQALVNGGGTVFDTAPGLRRLRRGGGPHRQRDPASPTGSSGPPRSTWRDRGRPIPRRRARRSRPRSSGSRRPASISSRSTTWAT